MRSGSTIARILSLPLFAIALASVAFAQSGSHAPLPSTLGAHARPNISAAANDATPVVARPVFSVPAGAYSGPQTVTVTDATPGVTMYYSLDGSNPTPNSPQYNGSIAISKSCTLVVLATAPGYESNIAYAAYYITSVPDSFVYRVAGSGWAGYEGDGGPATQALLNNVRGTAVDSSGNFYIADSGNNVVRKVDPSTGIISTVAGTGVAGYSGDGGQATSAQLNAPNSLAFDNSGNLYIGDGKDGTVRKVTMSSGVISTYAGNPQAESFGDGGPATSANLISLVGIAFDGSNNLYIAVSQSNIPSYCVNGCIREVDNNTKIITTVAGGGTNSPSSGMPAVGANLGSPTAIALDSAANIYISSGIWDVVWKVTRGTGDITTYAGTIESGGYSGDGGPATAAKLDQPTAIAIDGSGNLYISDQFNWVFRRVDAVTGIISTAAGNGTGCFAYVENGSAARSSAFCFPGGFSFDAAGDLYFADSGTVYELTALGTPPSTPTPDPAFSLAPGAFSSPQSLSMSDTAIGASINLYVVTNPPASYDLGKVDYNIGILAYNLFHNPIDVTGPATVFAQAEAPGHTPSNVVSAAYTYSVPPASLISVFAGGGTGGFSGQGGPATSTSLSPYGLAMDSAGNLFIADAFNNVVWKDDASGIISIVAGTGQAGHSGDNGPATSATLNGPEGVVVDGSGNLFISDFNNHVVREVLASNGNIIPYAGDGSAGYTGPGIGDGGPATSAYVPFPVALALDAGSNLYLTDGTGLVRKVDAATGIIQTFAGDVDNFGVLGDGGPATSASLSSPNGLALDTAGDLYIADSGNDRVREVNAKTGIISTVAGNGMPGVLSSGLATAVPVEPSGVALDGEGNLLITDQGAVRRVDAKTNMISSIAGIGYSGYGYDPESASMTVVCPNLGILADAQSNVYFSDGCNDTVRKITFNVPAPAPTFDPPAGTYTGPQSVTIADAVPNSTIYYTTDGSTPTTSSTQYTGAITVSKGETINAIAVASGYGQSPVGSAAYSINPVTPAIAVTSSTNPSVVAQSVTFTAAVTSSAGTPTGSVTFWDGTTQLGSGTLAAGMATYATSTLAAGSHSITAQYSGDVNFTPVTSAVLTQTVNTFSIGPASGAPTSANIAPGGTANFVLSVTPPANSPVTLTVTGLPSSATSSFSPNPVPAAAGPTNVQFIINLPAQSSAATPQGTPFSRMPLALGLLLLPFLGLRKSVRRAGRFLVLAFLAIAATAGLAALSGCGSHNFGKSSPTNPVPEGAYTLTVTATAGSQSQTTTLTLNVQ